MLPGPPRAVTAGMAARAESAFEGALASGGSDVQAAAERFRAAHRAHVEARTEVAELEAAVEGRSLQGGLGGLIRRRTAPG